MDVHDRVNALIQAVRNHQVNNNTSFNTFMSEVYDNYRQKRKMNNINMLCMNNIFLQDFYQGTFNIINITDYDITTELCNNNLKKV